MSVENQTIATYDQSAEELAAYFGTMGARVKDIELGLEIAGSPSNARVVEAGCGDGRDAEAIVSRVGWYEGFDPSEGLLTLARKRLPEASFVKADALSYEYPEDLDVVFAFASLLHIGQEDMTKALAKITAALRPGGIAYLSLKERSAYEEEVQTDQYGTRTFYYYTPELVKSLAGSDLSAVHEDRQTIGSTNWFTLALKKI